MEKEIVGWSVDTRVAPEKLREVCRHVCRKYKVRCPKLVVKHAGEHKPFGWCNYHSIVLNKDWHGDNYATLLHELAHWIDGERNDDKHEAHGPYFVAIYRELLHKYKMLPKDCFDLLAKRHGIKAHSM